MIERKWGWRNSTPDHRDTLYKFVPTFVPEQLPPSYDTSSIIDWMYDQGSEGSCTAQSSISCTRYERKLGKLPEIIGSRNFQYWNTRKMEGDTSQDNGAQIRDAMKVLNQTGICHESLWDYMPSTLFATPPKAAYIDAAKNVVSVYQSVDQNNVAMRSCLASGHPFVFGFAVYESFMSEGVAHTGVASMPDTNEKQLGGHAVMAVGYDDATRRYKIMNSWGAGWGDKGYFYLPYAYVEDPNLADDFWTVRGFKEIVPAVPPKPQPKPVPRRPWWWIW